jgi:hypothetical protein
LALTGDGAVGWSVTARGADLDGELQVYVGAEAAVVAGRAAVLGVVEPAAGGLRWVPRFVLDPGRDYTAVWRPRRGDAVRVVVHVPERHQAATTVVADVFPTAPRVPENLLRMYVQFSAPMSRGRATDFVDLLDSSGAVVADAFVLAAQELWSPDDSRLTLFFDPGRLKQGVGPNLAMGPPLREGQQVTLRIRAGWPDARGVPLADSYTRRWEVGIADRARPTSATWDIVGPATAEAELRINFPEPLDRALLQRMLVVLGPDGEAVAGKVTVPAGETAWTFMPTAGWGAGDHEVVVDPSLEDLAGNSLERLFDEPLRTEAGRPSQPPLRLQFHVER